jgi:hypothetical protein
MGLTGMGSQVLYCSSCGIKLLGSDFDRGLAGHVLDRCFCVACRPSLVTPPPAPEAPRTRSTTHVRRAQGRKTTAIRRKPSLRRRLLLALGGLTAAAAIPLVLHSTTASDPVGSEPPPAPAAPVAPRIAPPAPPPPSPAIPAEVGSRLESLRVLLADEAAYVRHEEVARELSAARDVLSRHAPDRLSELLKLESAYRARCESAAEALHDEYLETATVLSDEGRFDDALAKLETFPKGLRQTKTWNSLQGLQRQIEAHRRARAPR